MYTKRLPAAMTRRWQCTPGARHSKAEQSPGAKAEDGSFCQQSEQMRWLFLQGSRIRCRGRSVRRSRSLQDRA